MKRYAKTLLCAAIAIAPLFASGCVYEPYHRHYDGAVWVPGHWGGYHGDVWIAGHWR